MRLYNGCPDSELQAIWDAEDRCREQLKSIGCKAVYFPAEGKYIVFDGYDSDGNMIDYSKSKQVTDFCSGIDYATHQAKLVKGIYEHLLPT